MDSLSEWKGLPMTTCLVLGILQHASPWLTTWKNIMFNQARVFLENISMPSLPIIFADLTAKTKQACCLPNLPSSLPSVPHNVVVIGNETASAQNSSPTSALARATEVSKPPERQSGPGLSISSTLISAFCTRIHHLSFLDGLFRV